MSGHKMVSVRVQTIGKQLLNLNQEKFDDGITKRKVALKYIFEVSNIIQESNP